MNGIPPMRPPLAVIAVGSVLEAKLYVESLGGVLTSDCAKANDASGGIVALFNQCADKPKLRNILFPLVQMSQIADHWFPYDSAFIYVPKAVNLTNEQPCGTL